MARRKLIAGNWKMNGLQASLAELDGIAERAGTRPDVDVLVCPPFTLIGAATARQPDLAVGGQDCHAKVNGAHTACISAAMLSDLGVSHVIVGHSERRADNHETSADVKAKAEAAMAAGLVPVICVGEPEDVRDAGVAVAFVVDQLVGSLPDNPGTGELVIAYEPVWAIGTGRTPTNDQIAEMHAAIRNAYDTLGHHADALRILYGGSVKPDNAAIILALPNVDGALVGGASLKAADFGAIIDAA
jgi:triosephosphate isomerase (TIM)